ncbi:hypothetical protein [Methylobacterium aquaticum]|uniref:hypothetical protein n=1 Tax=Methylobacterium aquaticum TaxID=270351 RepID=UPI0012E2AD29|nr:hypothetical protein [Methylobacterium aquaticum]
MLGLIVWGAAQDDDKKHHEASPATLIEKRPFNKMLEVRELVELNVSKWERGGSGYIGFVWASITNNSQNIIKDVELVCDFTAKSGTIVSTSKKVIYQIFKPKTKTLIKRFDMGFFHSQAERATCSIGDLVVLD